MNNYFGSSSVARYEETYKVGELPKYQTTIIGTETDVRNTGSAYYNAGWKVNYTKGDGYPFQMVASLEGNTSSDGFTPVTSSVSSSLTSVKYAMHYKTADKEILHAGQDVIPWVGQLTAHQVATLEQAFNNPPNDGDVRSAAVPSGSFNTGAVTFSGSYTAGDVVWWLAKAGQRSVPVTVPVFRMTVTTVSGSSLIGYVNDLFTNYSAATLVSNLGVPTNWASVLIAIQSADSDPAPSTTFNLPMYYGWLKQPPSIDQDGSTLTIQQEWEYGLYPQNIYGSRI